MKRLSYLEYCRIARFFEKCKVIHGPLWVDSTLKRHKDIYLSLQDFEKSFIIDLESSLIHSKELNNGGNCT